MDDGIFVSYSHKDSIVVEKIVAILRETSGKEVWFDHNLRGGENYFSVIANQIIKNKYFVFIVSDNSIDSDWCLRELEFAASEKRHIIAIWLDNINISPRIKLVIQNTHYINWYSTTDYLFSQAVSSAFNDDVANHYLAKNHRDSDEEGVTSQKYFLSKDDLKNICDLLWAEENEKYSTCFVPENANLLGIAYELGVSVEPDLTKAALYYKASKYSGNFDGQYLYAALKYQTEPDQQKYLSDMIDAAEKGSVRALTQVGNYYYFGENGFPVDKKKAYDYFEKAAKKNGIETMYYIAYGYNKGECVSQDFELAYMYALKAKEYDFPRAYRLLAYMYEDGKYLEKDVMKAIDMYEHAIKLGDHLSLCYQGYLYGELGQTEKKVELYRKAVQLAEDGKIKSGVPFFRWALLHDEGIGVEQNFETAIHYYFKAAEREHKRAIKWTVPCILNYRGDKKKEYLQKAYELKCEKAAYELGQIEKSKRSSNKEKLSEKAIEYFESGAESGDINCILELLWNYSFVIGNGKNRDDRSSAIKWFRFFFANTDESFINSCRENNILATYYYAYAIELDYDPDVNMPDREFVLYNFKKSVEECPMHLGRIIGFSVDGYLFPEESNSGLKIDVTHAEEVLNFTLNHLNDFYKYIKENNPDGYTEEWKNTTEMLKKGYMFISKCYKSGKNVFKDKDKAERYYQIGCGSFAENII